MSITINTKTGVSTIRLSSIIGYCVNEEVQGVLKKNTYSIDIHTQGGTIFTANMAEGQLLAFKDSYG